MRRRRISKRSASPSPTSIVPVERVNRAILVLRGHNVILDKDLAELYGVPVFRLNEAVKRNRNRFPPDFMFRLTGGEYRGFDIAICDVKTRARRPPLAPTPSPSRAWRCQAS